MTRLSLLASLLLSPVALLAQQWATYEPAGKGNGVVIARVVAVAHPEPDVSSAQYVQFRQTAAQQLTNTAVDTIAAASQIGRAHV